MSYYPFNKKETLQKAEEWYSEGTAVEYYLQNKEAIKEVKQSIQKLVKRRKRQD